MKNSLCVDPKQIIMKDIAGPSLSCVVLPDGRGLLMCNNKYLMLYMYYIDMVYM